VKADLSVAMGQETVGQDGLAAALDRQTGGNREERVFLRADKAVSYGDLMGVMNTLRGAGYLKLALVGLEDRKRP
jgi:biopolymer transport protein ExbD